MATSILDRLQGGDRRSIGRADEVVEEIRRNPRVVKDLVRGLTHEDPLVRMRAADVLEKATRDRPGWLNPFKRTLIRLARESDQPELRWHLAQMLPRLPLDGRERGALATIFRTYLRDRSSIVKTCALQALADLAERDSGLWSAVRATIHAAMADGTPAMRARGRRLLARHGWRPARKQS